MTTPVIGSLFSGYGGLERAVTAVLGGTTAWVSDIDPGACRILEHRYPGAPNLGDITTIDWATVPRVDVITGGSPCQDVSLAGRRAGMREGTRSGLWRSMLAAVEQLRPSIVIWENVRGVLNGEADSGLEPCAGCVGSPGDSGPVLRPLGRVLGDLADVGYDARWLGLRASDVGAPHARFRVFVVAADTKDVGHERAWSAWGGGAGPADRRGDAAIAPDAAGPQGPQPTAGPDVSAWCSTADPDRCGLGPDVTQLQTGQPYVAWGDYGPAITRWASVLGRPAPALTEPGKTGPRLSPRFVEWMMGLPDGHVVDVPGLTRNQALNALGNGVVPRQAEAALRHLLLPATQRSAS